MKKCDVLTFPKLHSILVNKGIVGANNGVPQTAFYTYMFYLDSKSLSISNGRLGFIDTYQENDQQKDYFQNMNENVSRWCKGKRPIDSSILKRVSADSETAMGDFKIKLERLLHETDKTVPNEIEQIFISYIENNLLNDGILIKANLRKNDAHLDVLACAFVEALINENIQKEIKEIELIDKIRNVDEECKSKDFFTSTPFLLLPFIQRGDSILIKAVKSLKPEYEKKVEEAIIKYCKKETHRESHPNWCIEESDVLFYAKKYAYMNGHSSVGEREILLAVLLADSESMTQISNLVGGEQSLREAILASYRHATSTLSI